MDTDNLSQEAYAAIMLQAEAFHHDITLRFGVLSGDCDNEAQYLNKAEKMIFEWLKNIEYAISLVFFDNPLSETEFKTVLNAILANIEEVRKIPYAERHFYF